MSKREAFNYNLTQFLTGGYRQYMHTSQSDTSSDYPNCHGGPVDRDAISSMFVSIQSKLQKAEEIKARGYERHIYGRRKAT